MSGWGVHEHDQGNKTNSTGWELPSLNNNSVIFVPSLKL